MAPTDSEKGQVPGHGPPGEGQLEVVPFPDHLAELGMRGLAVEGGVDVGATREDEPLDPVQELGGVLRPAGSQENRQAPRLLDRADVVLPEQEQAGAALVVADGHPDRRTHHIRSGTGMPRRSRSASIWRTNASTAKVRKARRSSSFA